VPKRVGNVAHSQVFLRCEVIGNVVKLCLCYIFLIETGTKEKKIYVNYSHLSAKHIHGYGFHSFLHFFISSKFENLIGKLKVQIKLMSLTSRSHLLVILIPVQANPSDVLQAARILTDCH